MSDLFVEHMRPPSPRRRRSSSSRGTATTTAYRDEQDTDDDGDDVADASDTDADNDGIADDADPDDDNDGILDGDEAAGDRGWVCTDRLCVPLEFTQRSRAHVLAADEPRLETEYPVYRASDGTSIRRTAGVTLLELMAVVMVIGVLAVIAVPSYRQYVLRAQRTEAKSALLQLATNQERFYLASRTYGTVANLVRPICYPAPKGPSAALIESRSRSPTRPRTRPRPRR